MGGERKPSAWRSAVVRRSQANLPPVALQASHEGDLRRWHTHGRALALTARVGELRPCGRVEGERRQLQGAHPAVRARAPSSGAASARRCSIGRMREYVLRRRSRVLPRRESGARAPMLGAGAGPPPPSAELLLGNDGKESRFTAAVGERGRRRWMHGR